MSGVTLWRYRRKFEIGSVKGLVRVRSSTAGLFSALYLDGELVARDQTPPAGPNAVRNHWLAAQLPDGSSLEVDAGYISALNVGIAVRRDGALVHESHPGRTIAYPEEYREAAFAAADADMTFSQAIRQGFREGLGDTSKLGHFDFGVLRRNAIPLAVDFALGLLFYIAAKQTDLTTAAIIGAVVGVALLAVQRVTRIDLLGGLALFGIMLLILSAVLAVAFQSEEAVKYRSSVVGLVSAGLFLVDGLAGGNRLAIRLMRYLPYRHMDASRLGIGMGVLGIILAALNVVVARYASTDVWLLYTTFADFAVAGALGLLVFGYAQGRFMPEVRPRYQPTEIAP
jgi:intracellular septation protein A